MGDKSKIEWTDATWNVIRGCSRVSEGCRNCYAERQAIRQAKPGEAYHGLVRSTPSGPHWTGKVEVAKHLLDQPLRWTRPRRIFVNAMSDLFHESLTDEQIDQIFAVMALSPRHTFQVLTKRPERMLQYLRQIQDDEKDMQRWSNAACVVRDSPCAGLDVEDLDWPLPNIWLGVSVEDQKTADERIPLLLQTPAAVTWISYEPALGSIDLSEYLPYACGCRSVGECYHNMGHQLSWIVAGGESGPGARPCHPQWIRDVRDQCQSADVPFLFKQWGEYRPLGSIARDDDVDAALIASADEDKVIAIHADGVVAWGNGDDPTFMDRDPWAMERVGKRSSGRLLDEREWNEYPHSV